LERISLFKLFLTPKTELRPRHGHQPPIPDIVAAGDAHSKRTISDSPERRFD
jgi:hypothetical protein